MFSLRPALIFSICSGVVAPIVSAGPVEDMIKFVVVGDPRNPDEDGFRLIGGESFSGDLENTGVGYVGQIFEIGETEVTNAMYARFLNAVAKSDRLYGLYTTLMATDAAGGIIRSGGNGAYSYTVKAGFEDRPVNFVSSFDAMRFINWLHNGMPSGGQTAATTEDGAYTLLGANSDELVRRNPGAKYFLPDADEWHKAAFYDPEPGNGRPSESYWPYADQTITGPGGHLGAVPSVVRTVFAASHYGTYDQGGNVAEWTDTSVGSYKQGTTSITGRLIAGARLSGSSASGPKINLIAKGYSAVVDSDAKGETPLLGFRVAKPSADSGGTPPSSREKLLIPILVVVAEESNPPDNVRSESVTTGTTTLAVGRVLNAFQMGAYEVTNEEYAKFLNAAAKADTFYGLFDARMQTDPAGGIERSGAPGNFVYRAKSGKENQPVNFVNRFDAMRFCNWLHNGAWADAATGDYADTEAGAYRLLGNLPADTSEITRNPAARYFLPSDDEWHKAAFYETAAPGKPSASYWKYATRTDEGDIGRINYAKFYGGITDVFLPGVASYFGTFGQSGNVAEIVEPRERGTLLTRGGSWESGFKDVSSSGRGQQDDSATVGFRVAAALGVPSGPPRPTPSPTPTPAPLLKPVLVPVGDPLNPGDDNNDALGDGFYYPNRGAVPYEFQIGAYEVSNAEYAIFLNAVAKSDPLRLYNSRMDLDPEGGIKRTGRSGSFVYTAKTGRERKPVNFVDLYSAMRYCNWLHNGAQPNGRTESGAYQIFDESSFDKDLIGEELYIRRSAAARFFLPNDSEWHKAAFYDPAPTGKPTSGYWLYATKSDLAAPGQINFVNASGGLVDIDRYSATSSHFGTFAQSGNVAEWTESRRTGLVPLSPGSWRLIRGGSFKSGVLAVSALADYYLNERLIPGIPDENFKLPTIEADDVGFRVAAAPGIESGSLPPGPPPPPKGTKQQTITFRELPKNKKVGSFAFKISPKASSGLPVTCESSDPSVALVSNGRRFTYVFVRGAGSATITAKQEGDTVWAEATPVARSLQIAPRASRLR